MNMVSSILRLLSGTFIVVMCILQHQKMVEAMAGGREAQLFGHPVGLSESQMDMAFIVVGLLGGFVALTGAIKLLKR